uniref:Aminotransferase class I/classII large domain-containing protein n=2 Tax=Kalanchoe fedtschenkoi TaxID=63787 RepID=A0A7N1A771_KALFE
MGSYDRLAKRAVGTSLPVMVQISEFSKCLKDPIPLAQGSVYWQPPEEVLEKMGEISRIPSASKYGSHEGLPQLKEALTKKLQEENGLYKSSVMITSGSNQGFMNLILTLCDVTDSVVLFAPYFFNAYDSFRLTGISKILVGPSDPKTLQPDADWLEMVLSNTKPVPKLVSVVNPGNPSGTCIPHHLLKRISEICQKAGTWLVVDNAYEYFLYDNFEHSCVEGNHVFNLFTFSKAYGMMGWRLGYIAYPSESEGCLTQLLKAQDNLAICAPVISQHLALSCLDSGRGWVKNKVKTLIRNKELLIDALQPLGPDAVKGGQGAIYLWVNLPASYPNDVEVVKWMARKHGVVLLPGSASGGPGCVRVTFGGLREDECEIAALRLKRGLEELVTQGMVE